MVEGNGLGAGLGQSPDHGVGESVEAARLSHHDPAAVQGAGRAPKGFALADAGDGDRVVASGLHPQKHGASRRATHAVGGEAGVALKLEHGPLGVLAEDAVDPSGVEAQGAQPPLEVGDVVAPERGRRVVQQAVTELVARLDQRAPRLGAADPVDPQAPPLLEGADGGFGARPVQAGAVGAGLVPGRSQAGLQIPDRLAHSPLPEQGLEAAGYRNSASSWTSWPLPLAPIRRFLATPSWKSTSVGMLMIS